LPNRQREHRLRRRRPRGRASERRTAITKKNENASCEAANE
jgi:hypothetical protein